MLVVDTTRPSMLQSAVEVVKTSFASPCACAVAGVSTSSFCRPDSKHMPLSAITSSTFSVDSCDDASDVCDEKGNGGANGDSRLASPSASSELRLAAAIACEEGEESRDQSMDDPRQQQHLGNRREGHEDGFSRTDASAGYGLVPYEQIAIETKGARTNSSLADSCQKKSKGGSDRPPIAKPPISKTLGGVHGDINDRGTYSLESPSDGSGESFIQGEALLSTSGDDCQGKNIRHHRAPTTDEAYHISVLASYSSASEATADSVNASIPKNQAEGSSLSMSLIRDTLTVATTASASASAPHDKPPEPRSPAVHAPFSPGAHSSCTNPSYVSSSSEDDEDDDAFDVESLQGDLYKIAQMQMGRQHLQEEPMHHRPSPDELPHLLADLAIAPPASSHKEYTIQGDDSREWLKLDSLSGDGRQTHHQASPTGGKYEGDQGRPLASTARRFFGEQSSSLSLDVIEIVTSPQSESARGGLASLDAILLASSSLSDYSDDSILTENEEVVRVSFPEGEILRCASVDSDPICKIVNTSTNEATRPTSSSTSLKDRGITFSDLSSERAPVSFFLDASVLSLDPITTTIEGRVKERTHFVKQELEKEYQDRVEGMKRQYSTKLKRLRRQLDIQLEHDLQEQMHRAGLNRCIGAKNTQQASAQNCLRAYTSGANDAVMADETRSLQSTQPSPKLTGETNLSKKQRKEAMEEKLQSLMLRLNTPAASTKPSHSRTCASGSLTTETTPLSGATGDDLNFDSNCASETARTTLMSITKIYETQQNWLLIDLENDAEDKAALLQVECEMNRQQQAAAVKELKSLAVKYHIQEKEFKEERTEIEKGYKFRIAEANAELQQLRDDNEELCAGLKYEVGREENSIKDLSSRLEETRERNATLKTEINEQTNRIDFLRSESVEVQERLKKLTRTLDQQEDEHKNKLEREKERTNDAVVKVRTGVHRAIDKQFEEGEKKKQALEETQQKVTERLAALQKLLAITESSKASFSHEWDMKELELMDQYKHLEQSTNLTEERKANKGVAFARVVGQLNESYELLTRTIDTSRNDIETSQTQAEGMKCEISQLKRDNEQVSSWISELDAVLRSMHG